MRIIYLLFISVLLLFANFKCFSQSYIGFPFDNHSGINTIFSNPANVADNRIKADINLLSFSAFAGNSVFSANIFKSQSDNFNFERDVKKDYRPNSYLLANIDIIGPSLLYSFDNQMGLGLFTRARSITHVSEVNGTIIGEAEDKTTRDFRFDNESINASTNSWLEYGVSFGENIIYKYEYYLKVGLNIKYLQGKHMASVHSTNLSSRYFFFNDDNLNTTVTSGNLETVNLATINKDQEINEIEGKGIGLDFGIVYEYRPTFEYENVRKNNKYKYKIGVSITDIGKINYKNVLVSDYNLTGSFTDAEFNNNDQYETYYSKTTSRNNIFFQLPTALHLNFDWLYKENYYLNFNTDINLIPTSRKYSIYTQSNFGITPRYETNNIGVSLPFIYVSKAQLHSGIALRYYYFFIGSGSMVSNIFTKTKMIDLYFGLKIPIHHGKEKDLRPCKCF